MEVLLTEDVKTLGYCGEVVKVKQGYARNYLLPKGLAVVPTPQALDQIAAKAKKAEAARIAAQEGAETTAKKLENASVTIQVKVGDNDQLYGGISSQMIVDAVKEELAVEVPADAVVISEPIKELGTFVVDVKLHAEVIVPVKVWVVNAEAPAKEEAE